MSNNNELEKRLEILEDHVENLNALFLLFKHSLDLWWKDLKEDVKNSDRNVKSFKE